MPQDRRPGNAWIPDAAAREAAAELAHAADVAKRLAPQLAPHIGEQAAATVAGQVEKSLAHPPKPEDAPPPTARAPIVSTAAGYTIGDPPTGRIARPNQTEGWDKEVWAFYDATGELHYVAGQYGRAVSRARLFVAKYDEGGEPVEVKTGEAGRLNRELLGGEARRGDLLYLSAVQQFMTGQSLLTISDDDGWEAYSDQDFTLNRAAIRQAARGRGVSPYKVDNGMGQQVPLAKGVHTIHMWDRHPGRAAAVDSSVRAGLPYLRELARLDQYVQALLLSRIALSGILQIPPGTEVVIPPELASAGIPQNEHGLMHVLAQIGVTNITNPGTASAVLPVLLQMAHPDQELKHLTLDTPLTGVVNEFRNINLKRLAMSMDMAPEAMSGFSDVKYSNAEWIQDESVQTHIVRRVQSFASALTSFWVVPALGDEYLCAYDVSDLESDKDQTDSAIALYDRGEIDGAGLRRKSGMKDAQPPEGADLVRQFAIRAITTNPTLFPVLAPLLGPEVRQQIDALSPEQRAALTNASDPATGVEPQQIPDAAPPALPDAAPTGPTPVRGPQPINSIGVQDDRLVPAASAALVAACDVVVCSALASAGSRWRNRVRARAAKCRTADAATLYLLHPLCADRDPDQTPAEYAAGLVADRWPQVPRVAALHAADPTCLQATLVAYVAELIESQRPHHPADLAEHVADCVGAGT